MKNLALSIVCLLTSCVFNPIESLEPEPYKELKANMLIEHLDEGYVRGDWVVSGSVTTSDEAGNFYNSLFIEDESGALEVRFSFYDSYKIYAVGQVVSIELFDKILARENGQLYVNLGNFAMGSLAMPRQNYFKPLSPQIITIDQINESMVGRYVEICGGEFVNGGDGFWSGEQRFAVASRNINVYTSPLASFAYEFLPRGKVDLRGIVTQYNGRFQLKLSSLEQVVPSK